MKVPYVGNMAMMVSAVLLAVLAICSHQAAAQVVVNTPAYGTIKYQSTTGPTPPTQRTTAPTQAQTTWFIQSTMFRNTRHMPATTAYVRDTTFNPRFTVTPTVSGSSIPRCSWSMWLVVTGASLYTLRHLLLQ